MINNLRNRAILKRKASVAKDTNYNNKVEKTINRLYNNRANYAQLIQHIIFFNPEYKFPELMLKKPDNSYEGYNLTIVDKNNNKINYNMPKESIIKLLQDHHDKIWVPEISETDYEYDSFGKYLLKYLKNMKDTEYSELLQDITKENDKNKISSILNYECNNSWIAFKHKLLKFKAKKEIHATYLKNNKKIYIKDQSL